MSVCTAASCLLCLVAMVTFQAGKAIRQVPYALLHDAKQTTILRCFISNAVCVMKYNGILIRCAIKGMAVYPYNILALSPYLGWMELHPVYKKEDSAP